MWAMQWMAKYDCMVLVAPVLTVPIQDLNVALAVNNMSSRLSAQQDKMASSAIVMGNWV